MISNYYCTRFQIKENKQKKGKNSDHSDKLKEFESRPAAPFQAYDTP